MKSNLVCALTVALVSASACADDDEEDPATSQYRQQMRDFVRAISVYGKKFAPGFVVIPQNGHELLTGSGEPDGAPAAAYLAAIDGVGREDLFFGFDSDDVATPPGERDRMLAFMDVAEDNGVEVLATNYCSTPAKMDAAYQQSATKGYISFSADHRELDDVPAYPSAAFGENTADVTSLAGAKNFLYLLNTSAFADKDALLAAIRATNHDVVITDLFYETQELTPAEVASLKVKAGGGKRLVVAYMSIGEAEDYRYYWQAGWSSSPPAWLSDENPDWQGNFKVRYWDPAWQKIIFGSDDSYLKRIIDAGFDGVYLDIIDAFEHFEDKR